MKTREEIINLLRQAKPELVREYGVKWLGLFGSYARGEQNEESDVDIVVEVDSSIGLRFVDLAETLESLLGIRTEVVSKRAIRSRNWELIKKELINV